MIKLAGNLSIGVQEWLFKDIELKLLESRWNCLLGPSGVGKTTILRLIANLETHGSFQGTIATHEGAPLPPCAYMAQQDLLMPWLNVLENVTLGSTLRKERPDVERAHGLVERVGLAEHINKFPSQLSGGMRQRAALARTLMEDRDLVLLDEPFSALDARTRADMQELAHELLGKRTVLLVTHDPSEAARLGDQNFIFDESGLRSVAAKQQQKILDAEAPLTLKLHSTLLTDLRRVSS